MSSGVGITNRLARSLRTDGVALTLYKCARFPFAKALELRGALWLRWVTRNHPPGVVFSKIYERNYWGNAESVSGFGSTLDNTASLRAALGTLFKDFSITSVYDAPCGDFNWMAEVVRDTKIRYLGVDIVPALIERNNARAAADGIAFGVADITRDPFPDANLWLCRDCLFHLSYADIYLALENFAKSSVDHVLTTTYIPSALFSNQDIRTGGFRRIDLFAPPFSLPARVRRRIEDTQPDDQPRELCLWTRDDVAEALPRLRRELDALRRSSLTR